MSDRREVNVERPEHSWIPFYRELAEKLVEDGWRDRQAELVGVLQRLQANGVPMPRVVEYMRNDIDPFTVFALFSRELRFENQLVIINALKTELKISVPAPKTRPIIPYADNRMVGFFSQFVGIEEEIETMWDLFEITSNIRSTEDISNNARLQTLIETALNVRGVGISKLTSALYWVNPYLFLHSDTVNAVGGKDLGNKAEDGESYLELLIRSHDLTSQPLPEINIAVYQGKEIELISSNSPRIWVIRAQDGQWTDAFANNGYIGLHHGMDAVDMSAVSSRDEVRRLFIQEHPEETNERSIGNRSSQVEKFHLDIRAGDYVLTPGLDREVRYGRFTSDSTYYVSGEDGLPTRNRRGVDWSARRLQRDELDAAMLQGGTTLYEVRDESRKGSFFKLINETTQPNVWIVRGGSSGASVDHQLKNQLAGVGFNLEDVDLSGLRDREDIRREYVSRHPNDRTGTVNANVASVSNFVFDLKIRDYVLMPGGDGDRIHYGKVISAPYYVSTGPWSNCRDIEWADRVATKRDLPSLPTRTRTVVEATDRLKNEFLVWMESSPKPGGEDDGGSVVTGMYSIDIMINEGVFLERSDVERMVRILESKRNLILQGPPGVGKTFIARKLAYVLMGSRAEERITSVQFHQSYSYEDFVGGFRPDVKGDQMVFTRQDGPFLKVCEEARDNPGDVHVVLIDEINRGNLSRVFGELLMLIEADKRKSEFGVTLQHRPNEEEGFFVPENVYIIGTMNLADRSLTGMNVAMRRRFGFVDLKPQFNERVFTDWLSNETAMPPGMRGRINTRMAALNSTIATDPSLGINYAVGHSFFCPPDGEPEGGWEEWYETVVEYEVRPLLREYWFDAPETANDHADELLAGD